MSFTVHRDDNIDRVVLDDLDHIRNRVTAEIDAVQSLVLVGSFGRGEGTVERDDDGISPLNDYDVVVICEKSSKLRNNQIRRKLCRLSSTLADELSIRFVDLILRFDEDMFPLEPTKFNYDMQHGYHVFYGKDLIADRPPITVGDISDEEIRRLLLNRLTCILECAEVDSMGNVRPLQDPSFLYHQTAKSIFAMIDSVLIAEGRYTPSYRTKPERIKGLWNGEVEDLLKQAIRIKVYADYNGINGESLWTRTRDAYLDAVADHYAVSDDPSVADIDWILMEEFASVDLRDRLRKAADPNGNLSVGERLACLIGCDRYTSTGAYMIELCALAAFAGGEFDGGRIRRVESLLGVEPGATTSDAERWENIRAGAVDNWYLVNH